MSGGNYMKLEDGQNKFRILSEAITGYEVWTVENKPLRFSAYPKSMPGNIRPDSKVKHFWAMAVWNYAAEAVQVLELTQSSIRDQIHDYYKLEEYGEPVGYDINITRRGEGLDTEYTVQALPPKPMAEHIRKAFEEKTVNLEALFDGNNPFEDSGTVEIEEMFDASHPPRPKSLGGN